ncbi:MAG: class I SAM-dependent methyltransferase [Accumulibacter sp.]|uniref:class I SAM-dependent methyltransferase n=1 Tax=Accumulibacter sp. TaxID=2053492 RepID=UPI003315FB10
MKIADPSQNSLCNEVKLVLSELPFAGARVLELGCGKAEKTRKLAETGRVMEIIALEVDAIQHACNLAAPTMPNVRFAHGGAEAIPSEDGYFDIVLMFKSLHHVPVAQMDQALREISRVLKPGGVAWISEPVYAGDFNDILRLFHDENEVREKAFAAICNAVASGCLASERQFFFNTRSQFDDFEQFDERMIRVTHSSHQLSPEVYQDVRERFAAHLGPAGATFLTPQRVDLLRKPADTTLPR